MASDTRVSSHHSLSIWRFAELHERTLVIVILAIMLLVKLAIWGAAVSNGGKSFIGGDTPNYTLPAQALVEIGRFAPSVDQPDVSDTLRTPGYPVFIALIYLILG